MAINRKGYNEMLARSYSKLRDLAALTASKSADKSPYDTGNNRDSIKWEEAKKNEYIIFTESGYGGWLEIGTSKMAAPPYIKPAYAEAAREIQH